MALPPKISILTPSFNQAQYIEQTICSVLDQGYPNLEYIIIDGGSTDGSADIIRKYEKHLAYWVSEKDKGQTHAINKGMSRATGDVRAYINSDDYYLPGAFQKVAEHFTEHPDTDLVHGRCRVVDDTGNKIDEWFGSIDRYEDILDIWKVWTKRRNYVQPEVFWSRRIAEKIGPFREELFFVMDYEYWTRILRAGGIVRRIDAEVAAFRRQPGQKSNLSSRVEQEILKVVQPLIFEKPAHIPLATRLRLQGHWLFDARFRKLADESVSKQEGRLTRWRKLSGFTLKHPQMLLSSFLWNRLRTSRISTPAKDG